MRPKTYFVTRHPGAVEWLRKEHPELAETSEVVAHWTPVRTASLSQHDTVIGILPIDMAAAVCAAGARFFALSLPNMPSEMRGRELTAQDMHQCGAEITEYKVTRCTPSTQEIRVGDYVTERRMEGESGDAGLVESVCNGYAEVRWSSGKLVGEKLADLRVTSTHHYDRVRLDPTW